MKVNKSLCLHDFAASNVHLVNMVFVMMKVSLKNNNNKMFLLTKVNSFRIKN